MEPADSLAGLQLPWIKIYIQALERTNIFNEPVNTQQFCVFYNITSRYVSAESGHHQVFLNFK
jgi:hypothetical protein